MLNGRLGVRELVKILHCADLHLDSPLRGLEADPDAPAERIRGATRVAFTNLVDFALDQGVGLVLIAGDLYDGDWVDWRTGQFLVRELERLTRAGVRVLAISGNHDAENVITRKLRWPEGARMLAAKQAETVLFPEWGVAVHGRGFEQAAVLENLLPSYPAPVDGHCNIGMLHTAAGGNPLHARYAPCSVEQLANHGYQYWALGHIHGREVLAAEPWIVFPGNLQGRHINEEGAKGGTLITIEHGVIVGEPVHHALDAVRWRRLVVDLTGAEDEDTVLALARQSLEAALAEAEGRLLAVRLHLTGVTAAHVALARDAGATREKIRNEALAVGANGVLWLEQVVVETAPPRTETIHDPMVALLLADIEAQDAASLADALTQVAPLLDRATGLRAALGEAHPATLAAGGEVTADLLRQAKDLLLARLEK
jgi:DNA repair exonuclease SbcCD nuclease subunit